MEKKKGVIYVVDDEELYCEALSRSFRKEGYEVVTDPGFEGVVQRVEETNPDLLLLDINLPSGSGLDIMQDLKRKDVTLPIIMITGDDTAETAVSALKLGAYDYVTKPFEMERLKTIAGNAIESSELKRAVEQYREEGMKATILGKSPAMLRLFDQIKKIASQRVQNLLILGESGTGKELVAKAVHNASPAYLKPFVAINCAALPAGLLESELFGHEKGSFTDAKAQKKGLFEEADGGTLLLDEIGDMDMALQAKLLRVLENRTVRKIGGAREIPFNVMVIATTHRDLKALQAEGKFRQDLFYRLNMFSLKIPPLRERKEDIPLIAEHFLLRCSNEFGKPLMRLSPEAARVLASYDWPGNVRELKSLFAKVCLLEEAEEILPEHLQERLEIAETRAKSLSLPESGMSLVEMERQMIEEALRKANGNMARAAQLLNISYDTMRYRMKKFGIKLTVSLHSEDPETR